MAPKNKGSFTSQQLQHVYNMSKLSPTQVGQLIVPKSAYAQLGSPTIGGQFFTQNTQYFGTTPITAPIQTWDQEPHDKHKQELRTWAKENGINLSFKQKSRKIKVHHVYKEPQCIWNFEVWFKNAEDATGFKLRWC